MSKKIIIPLLLLLVVTGCGSNKKINDKTKNKVNETIEEKVKDKESVSNLQLLDQNIILSSLGIEKKQIADFFGKIPAYNEKDGTLYLAIKPTSGNDKLVKGQIDNYIDNLKNRVAETKFNEKTNNYEIVENEEYNKLKNLYKEEYKGYYIYISSSDKDVILSELKKMID